MSAGDSSQFAVGEWFRCSWDLGDQQTVASTIFVKCFLVPKGDTAWTGTVYFDDFAVE